LKWHSNLDRMTARIALAELALANYIPLTLEYKMRDARAIKHIKRGHQTISNLHTATKLR
jgi:hypothetical protein